MDDLAKLLIFSFLVGYAAGLTGPGAVFLLISSIRKLYRDISGGD